MISSLSSKMILEILAGAFMVLLLLPLAIALCKAVLVEVEDETVSLITRFGKLIMVLKEPGAHLFAWKHFPGYEVIPVSLQRDFRHYREIHVNDRRGTTTMIDLWIEFRITDPVRALFRIEDWEQGLQSLLTHSATSILGTQEFDQILKNRSELGNLIKSDILTETERWGLNIENVFIRKVNLLPEVARHMSQTVAAQLERAKADVEENGRQKVALLEAETDAQVAKLVAEAKGQYPLAVSRAYAKLMKKPKIFQAYRELYDLSLTRPQRSVTFQGFSKNELSPLEAAMTAPPMPDYQPALRQPSEIVQ